MRAAAIAAIAFILATTDAIAEEHNATRSGNWLGFYPTSVAPEESDESVDASITCEQQGFSHLTIAFGPPPTAILNKWIERADDVGPGAVVKIDGVDMQARVTDLQYDELDGGWIAVASMVENDPHQALANAASLWLGLDNTWGVDILLSADARAEIRKFVAGCP